MTTVAIFGSRNYPRLDDVRAFMFALVERHPTGLTIISGGEPSGVDGAAEAFCVEHDPQIPVFSLRPTKIGPEEYAVNLFHLGVPEPRMMQLPHPHPTWAEWAGAATYRDMLIAQKADKGVAFQASGSPGTEITRGWFKNLDKPCLHFTPDMPFVPVTE